MRFTLQPRPRSRQRELLMPFVAAAASLVICGLLILIAGENPFDAIGIMANAAFGGKFQLSETILRASPMILTGLAALVALRARFWNIGGEGQLIAGAMLAAWVGAQPFVPTFFVVPAMLLAAALAGAAFAGIPAILKTRFRVDEVVTTLMLNFIILYIMMALLSGPWKDPVSGWTDSPDIRLDAEFPIIWSRTRVHLGVLVAFVSVFVIGYVMKRSVFGFSIAIVGENPRSAQHAGLNVNRVILLAALLSGALAGLAGAGEVGGVQFQVISSISSGYGYAGLVVAMLARLSAVGIIPAALFLAAIGTGADEMSREIGVPFFIADAVQGISLLAVIIAMTLSNHRIRYQSAKVEGVKT